VTIRPFNRWRMREESERLYEIYLAAWEKNWGFVPPSRDEFWHIVKDLKWVRDLSGMVFAEVDGKAVGACTVVPDVNMVLKGTSGRLLPTTWWRLLNMSGIITRARGVTTGVIPQYRDTGLLALLTLEALGAAKRSGLKEDEFSWVLENNAAANQTLANSGARMYKTYRLYEKRIA
jgi:hypothetical protein